MRFWREARRQPIPRDIRRGSYAGACYKKHNKPKDGCPDWHDNNLMLIPKTEKERIKEGMGSYKDAPGPKTYLCDFCPVAIGVAQRKQKLIGMN